jgi:hypothetical protein
MKKLLRGPGGITISLDSEQIIPDDPGAGTPAVVQYRGHSGTYWCAASTGELICGSGIHQLSQEHVDWLNSSEIEELVDTFMKLYSPAKKK